MPRNLVMDSVDSKYSKRFMVILICVLFLPFIYANGGRFRSLVGDPGMQSKKLRVALESWNFCNEVGQDQTSPTMPSPRFADCADLYCTRPNGSCSHDCRAMHKVGERDNLLAAGSSFPSGGKLSLVNYKDPDRYAVEKELYLASLCESKSEKTSFPWYFWMIMLKNGNYDLNAGLCPYAGQKATKNNTGGYGNKYFPCFGKGCMNHPLVFHNRSSPQCGEDSKALGLTGSFYGTYDVHARVGDGYDNISYFSVEWEKNPRTGSWVFRHKLKVSQKYPWLMLYLRADAISGFSGGYPYETRGLLQPPTSPNFRVRLSLNIISGGGPQSQFYLLDIGGCWKNDGRPCDGDVLTDVTRYSEMIINPQTGSACSATNLGACPPYHVSAVSGEKVHRTNTARFPYSAYHFYCAPPNARDAEKPFSLCDPFSNPQAQELVQLLPHPEWAVHGYPSRKGEGWIGDPRTWDLDVGALSSRLYFYQDIGTKPAKRTWPSIDVGTEIFRSARATDIAEWTLSDFDVISTL